MDLQNIDASQIDISKVFIQYFIPWATNFLFALAIFLIGSAVSKWIVKLVGKALGKSTLDPMLIDFLKNILRWVLMLLVIVAALDQLGVDTTSFIAILGAAGLAVGLALKDSLQNFASGVMLIMFRPFRTGDYIEAAGTAGVVEEIRIFSTQLRTPDNKEVIAPNGDIYSGVIVNVTAKNTRRIDLVVGIGYDDDLRKAKRILEELVSEDERVLKDPAPFVAVGELGGSSVDLLVRPWTKTSDYFATKCDLTERIKLALDDAGISIPYPQMDVHLDSSGERPDAG
ncbi:MAG: mechanosensitive ion channel [Verrucomicrobiales bacterium]|nr:mechanosensitive ion channel [Verrucomicrobiales bacterium]